MALQDIIQTILSEAEKKAQHIHDSTQKRINEYKSKVDSEITQQKADVDALAQQKKSEIDRKLKTTLSMEKRNQLLKVKRQTINNVFDKALSELCQLKDDEYLKVLEAIGTYVKISHLKEGKIIPAKGKKKITESFIQSQNSKLSVESEGDFAGGFIIQTEKSEIDGSFEALMNAIIKSHCESEVSKILF